MKMSKTAKILAYISFAFAFCFILVGYAAVQDTLLVDGTVSVDGYYPKYDLSAVDVDGYSYDEITSTITVKDIYYDSNKQQNYKVMGIKAGGFSSQAINDAKAEVKVGESTVLLEASMIESFHISESISEIGANAFVGLSNLKSFTIADKNTSFKIVGGVLFSADETTLVRYPSMQEGNYYEIPTTVTSVIDGAFSENRNCTAILTTLYSADAWGSPGAVMINVSNFHDSVIDITGNVSNGYSIYLRNSEVDTPIVLQGNDDPTADAWGTPTDVTVRENTDGNKYIEIVTGLCQPLPTGHYSQICISSWQKMSYGCITADKALEIYNCNTAIIGGEIYQWLDSENKRVVLDENVCRLPSGTVEGSNSLPEDFSSWIDDIATIKKVKVIDEIAPTSVSYWFRDMKACSEMDLAKLNTEHLTTMYGMFWGCESLLELDVSNFNTSNVKSLSYMFARCSQLTSIDVSGFNTVNVTSMSFMFANSPSLLSIVLKGPDFSTENVITMENMFAGCEKVQELDLSHFDTTQVKNMTRMFNLAYNLTTLNLSNDFNTANVTSMLYMFNDCRALENLDISSFDTSKVTSMDCMFRSCYELTVLDLSNFDTTKVTSMKQMFENSRSLETIYVSNSFVTTNVSTSNSANMFKDCARLVGAKGTAYSSNNTGKTYARIDGMNGLHGYFSLKTGEITAANVMVQP